MSNTKKKGDLLEDIVALIYDSPELKIEKRKRVKPLRGRKPCEIDVLISTTVMDYKIRFAIECKNEIGKFGIPEARNFKAKLDDIGVPTQNGIAVCVAGFTIDAQEYLNEHRIKTYVFEGLTRDRLSQAIYSCFQSHIFICAKWASISTFPFLPKSAMKKGAMEISFPQSVLPHPQILIDKVWEHWVNSKIPLEVGELVCFIDLHEAGAALVTINRIGLIGKLHGNYSKFSLKPTQSELTEKQKIISSFPDQHKMEGLESVISEHAIDQHVDIIDAYEVRRIRVPRLVGNECYWPPSDKAAKRIRDLISQGEEITFEKVEGDSLNTAWEAYDENLRRLILSDLAITI